MLLDRNFFLIILLIFSVAIGQLVKFPLNGEINSATVLDATLASFCLLGLFQFLKEKNLKSIISKTPYFFRFGFLFILICLISLALNPLSLTFKELAISFSYILRLVFIFLFSLFCYLNIYKIKIDQQAILITSGISLAILGLLQLIFIPDVEYLTQSGWDPHFFRTVSSFLDPNFLGSFLALTLLLLLINKKKLTDLAFYGIFFICFLAFITTYSRGALVTFIVSFLTYSLLTKSFRVFLLTILLTLMFGINFLFYQGKVAQPRNINREESAQFRLNSYQVGWEIFSKSPIIGVGFNTYRFALREFNLVPESQIPSRGSSTNDSSLLFVLATTGVVGLIVYLIFIGSLLKVSFVSFKNDSKVGAVLFSGVLGLILSSFFSNSLFYPFLLFWLLFLASAVKKSSN